MFNNIRENSWFWLLVVALFVVFIWLFQSILAPFILGLAIAYLLNPIVTRLDAKGAPRWLSTLFILTLFLGVLVLLFAILVPVFVREAGQLIEILPSWISSAQYQLGIWATQWGFEWEAAPAQQIVENLQGQASNILQAGKGVVSGIVAGGMAVVSFMTFVFLMPIVAFYMMVDWPQITKKVDELIPLKSANVVRGVLAEIDSTLAGFIRGQLSVCLILGLYYGIALTIIDLRFGFAIGIMAGVLSIIPYVGSVVGIVTSLAVAWFTTNDMVVVAVVGGIFAVGQFVEGNFLTPKMVGENVGLHPLWVIFALMAGGSIAGFVGMLIAVPVAAVIGVMVRFFLSEYHKSHYYTG